MQIHKAPLVKLFAQSSYQEFLHALAHHRDQTHEGCGALPQWLKPQDINAPQSCDEGQAGDDALEFWWIEATDSLMSSLVSSITASAPQEAQMLASTKKILSGLWVRFMGEVAEVDYISTLSDSRGRGLAKALLQALISEAQKTQAFDAEDLSAQDKAKPQQASSPLPVKEVWLEVEEGNLPARRLYESLGFEAQGLRKNYYGKDRHAVNYKRQILKSEESSGDAT